MEIQSHFGFLGVEVGAGAWKLVLCEFQRRRKQSHKNQANEMDDKNLEWEREGRKLGKSDL